MSARTVGRTYEVTPSAARLTESLRDIGYDFPFAIADLVDNSITAGSSKVQIEIRFRGKESYVSIIDDGHGMTANVLTEALRYGSRRTYSRGELGRYGLGLKTAPLSQCRRVSVVSRRSNNCLVTRRSLDLDLVAEWDSWLIAEMPLTPPVEEAVAALQSSPGTAVVWEKLDRALPADRPDGGWAKRRLANLAARTSAHLGMVFHRFLAGEGDTGLVITVNGEEVLPWNPFALDEPSTRVLPCLEFEVPYRGGTGIVTLSRFVLPPRGKFSSSSEFERLSGPNKWNRQQGLYIYRSNRLVQWGGWSGLRGIDEHTKLARAALDFDTDLDGLFNINVPKMRVSVPATLRQMIERPVHELCMSAEDEYRRASQHFAGQERPLLEPRPSATPTAAIALQAAAMELGHVEPLREIIDLLRSRDPQLAHSLGLDRV